MADPVDITSVLIEPWAKYGMAGSIIIALGALNWWQVKRGETKDKAINDLHLARLADQKEYAEKYLAVVINNTTTLSRIADGMEAFERVVDKVRPT